MAINAADGSKVLRTIFPEAVAGTAAAGAYQTLRLKAGAKIELTRNLIQSNELRSDRQQSAPGNGTKSVSVSLPIEWSYGTHDALLEATMGGTWTSDVLKVGNVVRTSAIEETHTDVGMLERATGVQFGMFSISKKNDAIVEGEFSGIGRALKIAQTTGVNLAYDSTGKTITRATAAPFSQAPAWGSPRTAASTALASRPERRVSRPRNLPTRMPSSAGLNSPWLDSSPPLAKRASPCREGRFDRNRKYSATRRIAALTTCNRMDSGLNIPSTSHPPFFVIASVTPWHPG